MSTESSGCPDKFIELKDWGAVMNKMPPKPDDFYVTGTVVCSTSGYKVALKKKEPQGINPKILLLDLTVKKPDVGGNVITDVDVRYDEKPPAAEYTHVQVFCGTDIVMDLEVQEVH